MGKRSREKRERREGIKPMNGDNRSKLEKVYFHIIEGGVYLSLLTPFVVSASFFFPYVSPKTIFFRIIVDIIAIPYVLLAVSNPRYRPKLNALTISLIVFLFVIILTSITGVNFAKSFWSTFERMAGILTFIHLFVFFVILSNVFQERKYWERILTGSIAIGFLLSFYVSTTSDLTARGGGSIGNTSFLTAYLLFDIFFAIVLILTKRGWWKLIYAAPLLLMLKVLLFPRQELTKGAISAFFGGIFILGFGYLLFCLWSSGRKKLKILAPVLIVCIVFLALGVFQLPVFKSALNNLGNSSSWQARAVVWKIGFEAWKERPLLGWGQENFNIPFTKHFDPSLPLTADVWYDRVHNIIFDTLVTSGIIGLLSYLAVFGVAIIGLLKICPKVADKRNIFFPLGMIALLVVYFAQDIWVFDMISSYMMFFLTLAFIGFLTNTGKTEAETEISSSENEAGKNKEKIGLAPFIGAPMIIASILTIYFGNIQPAEASYYIIKGVTSPLEQGIPYFQKSLAASPMAIIEAPEQLSRLLSSLIFNQQVGKEILKQGFEVSAADLRETIRQSPQDYRPYLVLGRQYSDAYLGTNDPKNLEQAEILLTKAIELSPENQQGYWSLAQTKLSEGKNQDAVALMQKATNLEPKFALAQWYLAMTYRAVGDSKKALEQARIAREVGYDWTSNLDDIQKMMGLYQDIGDNQSLVTLYTLAIQRAPKEGKYRAGLAVAYANLHQFDKAREYAKQAVELNPEYATSIADFLKSIPEK